MENVVHKYNKLRNRRKYEEHSPEMKKCVHHLGQLKLLLTEIHFLSKYAPDRDDIIVLYIGAACGFHIRKLLELFPKLHFELWDPSKFDISESDRVKIFNKYFTDEDVKRYMNMGDRILYVCDMRGTANTDKHNAQYKNSFETRVFDDMESQMKWCKQIRPIAASLKMRLGYMNERQEYLDGDMWLQPYFPASMEMRLFVRDYTKMKTYINAEADEKLAYFNTHERCDGCNKWADVFAINNIKNIWDNCYACDIIAYYISKRTGNNKVNAERVIELFNECVTFLWDRYYDSQSHKPYETQTYADLYTK